jgi:hypothetical protein
MKRVMMIAHPFPPEGSATSFRTLRHIRQLPRLGWSAQVITANPAQYERYDPNLLAMVPKEIEVIRVKAFDPWQKFQSWRSSRLQKKQSGAAWAITRRSCPQNHGKIRTWFRDKVRTVEAWWYHPDPTMPWIRPAVKTSVKVCERKRPDVIWANAGRVSAFHIAEQVSRQTGVPYVLDFDDSWTITHNDFEARQPRWAKRMARRKMYQFLKGAQAVVFRYHTEAECFWRAYRGAMDASRIYIIPNGYESPIEQYVAPAGDKCKILYSGTLGTYRYDGLLESLKLLKETDPERANQLRLLFVGEGMEPLADQAIALGLSDLIETTGPKSYAEINILQQQVHALLVLGRLATINGYELFAGAKLFGYLKAGRPIVGVLPADETKKILHRLGARTVADVDSVSDITRVLRLVLDNWSSGTLSSLAPDPKACEAYSSERQTATLVRALEGVPSEEPFIPGAQAVPPSLRETIENKEWLNGAS